MKKISTELLLDGSKMPAKEFYKEFELLVGCSEKDWCKKDTTIRNNDEECYEYKDDKFILGGTAYSPPLLYKII